MITSSSCLSAHTVPVRPWVQCTTEQRPACTWPEAAASQQRVRGRAGGELGEGTNLHEGGFLPAHGCSGVHGMVSFWIEHGAGSRRRQRRERQITKTRTELQGCCIRPIEENPLHLFASRI